MSKKFKPGKRRREKFNLEKFNPGKLRRGPRLKQSTRVWKCRCGVYSGRPELCSSCARKG